MSHSRKKKKKKSILEADCQNDRFYNMCLRKTTFWTEVSALFTAKDITEKGKPMRAYQCPNCYQWHLSSIKREPKIKKKEVEIEVEAST